MLELESVHIDPLGYDSCPNPDAQRLDLENAVLMQELMAIKVCLLSYRPNWFYSFKSYKTRDIMSCLCLLTGGKS